MNFKKMLFISVLIFSLPAFAAVKKNPMDVSGMDPKETQRYLTSLKGSDLEFFGVVKEAGDLKKSGTALIYEIPAYWRDGSQYVKYGSVCQLRGESKIIIADDGYLSPYVKSNVIDKRVRAVGRLLDGGKIGGLMKQMVFVTDSLRIDGDKE